MTTNLLTTGGDILVTTGGDTLIHTGADTASHPRQVIRDNVVSLLAAASTSAGSNVFSSRTLPVGTQIPAINVWTDGDGRYEDGSADSAGFLDLGTNGIDRSTSLTIEAIVAQANDADDALDDLCREIELALAADVTLNGSAQFSYFEGTEIEGTEEVDPPGLTARIRFTAVYEEVWT